MEETNGHANGTVLQEASADEQIRQLSETVTLFSEQIAELESTAADEAGWLRLTTDASTEFSRAFLGRLVALSRLMFLKNPLIKRGVLVQVYYVFGQGVSIGAEHPEIDGVIQAFLDDRQNQAELTSHQARGAKEQTLQVDGNVFLVLFTSSVDGRVILRSIPIDEVAQIIANPEDNREVWFYHRRWIEVPFDPQQGVQPIRQLEAYYPDWRHRPKQTPAAIGGIEVRWDSPVYHVKVGGLDGMRFGIPETYAALDWARAYKSFLEDWATITKALARFAWKAVVAGGPRGAAAARAKLNTSIGTTGQGAVAERNPPPLPGSTWITGTPGSDLTPIKTAGATTSAEDGRQLRLMVAAAMGLPDTFFGDADVGNHATASTLDRPTELKFIDRQTLWTDVLVDVLQYVVDQQVIAPRGALDGSVTKDANGAMVIELPIDPDTGEPISRHLAVTFPPILEHDVNQTITAIVDAATLSGRSLLDIFDKALVRRLLLEALGVADVDEIMDRLEAGDAEAEQADDQTADGQDPNQPPPPVGPDGSGPPQPAPDGAQAPPGTTDGTGASGRPGAPSEAGVARRPRGRASSRKTSPGAGRAAGRGQLLQGAAATDPAPVIPRGSALDLTDEQLDREAALGTGDLGGARDLWRAANAGTATVDLLDAEVEPDHGSGA